MAMRSQAEANGSWPSRSGAGAAKNVVQPGRHLLQFGRGAPEAPHRLAIP